MALNFPYPVLVSDVGGTNARFAIVPERGDELVPLPAQKTSAHADFSSAALMALGGRQVRSLMLSAAGPCEGRRIKLTNAAWVLEADAIVDCLKLDQGMMFNDFEAQALSLPALQPSWLAPIGPQNADAHGTRLIHGPGTGLGTAALLNVDGRYLPVASESGHMDFAPVSTDEHLYWPYIERRLGRITAETLISGAGITRLHRARMASQGHPRPETSAAQIVAAALADHASFEAETIRAFWLLVGRFAGDMAITFVATGGVTLAGGILPRIFEFCDAKTFRAAFEDKAPYRAIMERIPVQLLIKPDTVLAGLARIAAHPRDYALNEVERMFVLA